MTTTNTLKVWTAEEIQAWLDRDDRVVASALYRMYECQTEEEQQNEESTEHNGMGFNSYDAPLLTSFTKDALARGYLTPAQAALARKRLKKYIKQLVLLANRVEERKQEGIYEERRFIIMPTRTW